MLDNKSILAVVPARSGSKGIPHKNMCQLKGISLIGRAGITLSELSFLDARIISTDSNEFAREGRRYDLEAPFLRPQHLSTDKASIVETLHYVVLELERHYVRRFDVILIIEPTSPLRTASDVERSVRRLLATKADSVVTVSLLSTKAHPHKILTIDRNKLCFFHENGKSIKVRQALGGHFYWRNGVCYAIRRECLMELGAIFTENTFPEIITHPVVNIDDPIDLEWAEFLMSLHSPAFEERKINGDQYPL